jgi:hypothetical protein
MNELLPTTVVGSYPQPDWLVDRDNLRGRLPPRMRTREILGRREAVRSGGTRFMRRKPLVAAAAHDLDARGGHASVNARDWQPRRRLSKRRAGR